MRFDGCVLIIALLRFKQLLACCLAAVLVLTQTLGLVHGVTHADMFAAAAGHSYVHAGQVDHDDFYDNHGGGHQHIDHDLAPTPASGLLASVFASHEQPSDCRLYDQCSHGAGVVAVLHQVLPVVLPPSQVAIFQGNALARWAALFDARRPPLTV